MRGRIHHIDHEDESVHMTLEDGEDTVVPFEHVREPKKYRNDLHRFIGRVSGTPLFHRVVEDAIDQAGYAPFLAKHPLVSITESQRSIGAYGLYNWDTHKVRIAGHGLMVEGGKSYSAGDRPPPVGPHSSKVHKNLPLVGNDKKEHTIMHEIGHHLHLRHLATDRLNPDQKQRALDAEIKKHYDSMFTHGLRPSFRTRLPNAWVASKYATADHA